MWPSDLDYGILGFSFTTGIGGKIKVTPEDFIVQEISEYGVIPLPPKSMVEHGDGGGLYLGGRVWKRNVDHPTMISKIARAFAVKESDVTTAGIKDRRAISVQLISVYSPNRVLNDPIQLDNGIELDSFQRYRERIYPGRLVGNKFTIIIRGSNANDAVLEDFMEYANTGILNHYGYQRFGGTRPISAQFGRALLNNRFDEAIDLYIGGRSALDDEFRKLWRDTRDPELLLDNWSTIPWIERQILQHLQRRPKDYMGAIRRIPESVINITTSAFTSLLFNHYLSIRGPKLICFPGEREIEDNIEIALPSKQWTKPLNELWEEVFEYYNLDMKELKTINHRSRYLLTYPKNSEFQILNDTCEISFQLSAGAYATTVLRELMQVQPVNLS